MTAPLEARCGAVIREARARKRLSLRALAARSGLSLSYLSAVERGTGSPPLATYLKISAALGVRLSVVVARAEQLPEETPTP